MVLWEEPSSGKNQGVLALDCGSTISSKALSSTTECLPDFGVIFLEMSEPVLCHTFVDSF